ncbi:glycoside hydrolase family 16 protein [Haloplasma contractile]|uniref:Glucan endo-13-beta-D-glucosidase protein n=1 Tax=Haloplasma contractile SSD-17B TaxID=1033810 RepID=U2DSX5_9MOLU|nr:glycoside hydrolase family 16 protein [Haloplasma contractile]ERJ11597.1 glucan endo-13-beta-D-glucosidase protein [Haloplasma contractile SSD-17B]
MDQLKMIKMIIPILGLFILSACNTDQDIITTTTTTEATEEAKVCKAKDYTYEEDNLTYDLIWSDEFDGNELDETKWSYATGGYGFGNNELQYYTEGENLSVLDGKLIIETRKEDYVSRHYTSSKITTEESKSFKYAKIDVMAKIPAGRGTWPAIWMLPKDWQYGGWPDSGEIDIMEHVGYDMNEIHGTVHTGDYNHMKGTQKGGSIEVENVDTTFHKYSIEWLPDKIKFFVDDEKYYEFTPTKYFSCPDSGRWPFDQEFYLILNIAIGGNWGGARKIDGDNGVDDTIFPQTMEIDYIRVYQSNEITSLDDIRNN